MTGGDKELQRVQGVRKGYKGFQCVQGVTRGFKGLQGVTGGFQEVKRGDKG